MDGRGHEVRQRVSRPGAAEGRGGLWPLRDGRRLPGLLGAPALAVGDPNHPARLRRDDLDNPEAFHLRLAAWLLQQG